MKKRLKAILMLVVLSISMCIISNTYSRYVADTTGNLDLLLAKWQILVNTTDITTNSLLSIPLEPVIEPNDNVASNYMAPSSKGYFDIAINPQNVDVSFNYSIDLTIDNEFAPDLLISKYAILQNDYVEGVSTLTLNNVVDNNISQDILYDKTIPNFSFETFTIRIYFEWFEGENETMNDAADTVVGRNAVSDKTSFTITANIQFEQII